MDRRDRLGLVGRAVELAHPHAAQAEGRGRQAVLSEHASSHPRRIPSNADAIPARPRAPGLTKRYDSGLLALEDFDLTVPDGAFFGLLGPNGAGKTTLISAVCNLIRVTRGELRVFGAEHHTEARRMIGLAEQDINLDRFLDVEETLPLPRRLLRHGPRSARRRAGEMMDVFDLRAKADVRAPQLSGGMRRRLLLARALMHEPRLVILDEPTAGWTSSCAWSSGTTSAGCTPRHDDPPDDALPRGGRGALRGHRPHPRRPPLARDSAAGLKAEFDAATIADVYVKAMAGAQDVSMDRRARRQATTAPGP